MTQRQLVVVPDMVGLSALSARQTGDEAGLVVLGPDPDGPPTNTGVVVRQTPEADARVTRRTTVTVWTTPPGPRLRMVPDLVGLSGWEARQAGQDLGLVVIPDPEDPTPANWEAGTVRRQRPPAGMGVPWGAFVVVWTEGGPGSAGDREPRNPVPPTEGLAAELERGGA